MFHIDRELEWLTATMMIYRDTTQCRHTTRRHVGPIGLGRRLCIGLRVQTCSWR